MSSQQKRRRRFALSSLRPGRLLIAALGLMIAGLAMLQLVDRRDAAVESGLSADQINGDLADGLAAVGVNSSAAPLDDGEIAQVELTENEEPGRLQFPTLDEGLSPASDTGSTQSLSSDDGPLFNNDFAVPSSPSASSIPVTIDSPENGVRQAIVTTGTSPPRSSSPVWFTGQIEPLNDE